MTTTATTTTTTTTTETLPERIERLGLSLEGLAETRIERLERAHTLGVSDKGFAHLQGANRTSTSDRITLPPGKYERLSRGRGWARKGSGPTAEWGERVDDGYRVGPGRWVVGSTDGFRRKEQTGWNVIRVTVGDGTWLAAF